MRHTKKSRLHNTGRWQPLNPFQLPTLWPVSDSPSARAYQQRTYYTAQSEMFTAADFRLCLTHYTCSFASRDLQTCKSYLVRLISSRVVPLFAALPLVDAGLSNTQIWMSYFGREILIGPKSEA